MAGETTSLAAAARKHGKKIPGVGLVGDTYELVYAATDLETNDVMEAGYLPAGVKLLGFLYKPHDMDSSTGVVQKITVGATDVVTGLTGGQTGAGSLIVLAPIDITAPTLVKVTTTTTPSGTANAGTTYLTPIYSSNG